MPSIHQIIAAVNPDLYYKTSDDKADAKKELQEFKQLVKEKGVLEAAKKAKPQAIMYSKKDEFNFKVSREGLEAKHTLVYDSSSETLEPVYFFILDLMNDFHLSPEKLIDNFTSSPGSGHFGDLGQRATIMQQQATKILGDINNVTRSILNLVYDLKEFKIRMQTYMDLKSEKPETREAALLALKQIWMDKVDINKGNSSIKAMAFGGQIGFQTLVDAFLFAKDEKEAGELDLNDQVKRVVKSRINEFNVWLKESERELAKRYEMERKYLKSQVNSVKLYSRWAKPYMRSALQLEMKDNSSNPELVKTFNSILLELTLLGKSKLDVKSAAAEGTLPKEFAKLRPKKDFRDYAAYIVVDFKFRGIPQKTSPYQQHYVFGGRAEVTFTAYALNDEEIAVVKKQLAESDMGDALELIHGSTEGSLEEMQKDIDEFLNEEDIAEKKAAEKPKDTSNPFAALLGLYDKKGEKVAAKAAEDSGKLNRIPDKDKELEKEYLRPMVSKTAVETAFSIFDIYKKAHGMASYT